MFTLALLLQPEATYAQSGPICYGVTDGLGNSSGVDTLVSLDVVAGDAITIGETATFNIEAIAFSADGQTLYAVNQDELGTLDLATGAYTAIGTIGGGDGSEGALIYTDVDGLTFDIATNTLFGSVRRGVLPLDLLIKIDPATGAAIPDAFGPGVDYVAVPASAAGETDVDDIAADPYTGVLYGVVNAGGAGGTLVEIDKTTGGITELGVLGSSDIEGLGFARDGVVGTLYGSTGDNGPIEADNNDLYLIDKTNGASTLIDGLPETETLIDYESLDCIYQSGNIGDTIWSDDDQDGNELVDGDDVVLEGVVVNLLDSGGNVVATDTTDAAGNYLFEDVAFGTYTVQIDTTTLPPIKQGNPVYDPDGGDDSQSSVTISVDKPNDFDQDFAYHETLGTIGDTIFHDSNGDGIFDPAAGDFPLPGITVTLTDDAGGVIGTAVTDANGLYLFEELPLNATYTVLVDTAGLPEDKIADPSADPDGGADSTSQVTLTDAVREDLDQDFGYEPQPDPLGSIGDTIFHDANSDGAFNSADGDFPLAGVMVTLSDSAGNVLGTETTDANGLYLFDELPLDETYTVVVDTTTLPASKITDPTADPDGGADSTSEVMLTEAAPDDLDQDFGYEPILGSIGDTIFHDANSDGAFNPADGDFPLGNVVITLSNEAGDVIDSATTNGDGFYLFENLPVDETYTVTVDTSTLPDVKITDPTADPDGGADSTSEVMLTPDAPDDMDQDFGYEPIVGSIGDTIFHDANSDGMLDPTDGDFPLENVTVTASNADGVVVATATTDANGNYLLEELPVDQTYTIIVDSSTLPADKLADPTADPDGGADGTSMVMLTVAVPDNLDQDFGYEPVLGAIGDTIFHDANGDGMMNPADGDFPLEGITVTLTDADGVVLDSVMTDADGNYLFEELPVDETYTVIVDSSTLPADKLAAPTADPDGGADGTSEVMLTAANPEDLDQDFGYEPILGSIGNQIWHDDDQDGNASPDGDDRPIEGVVVQLLDSNGDVVATEETDSAGMYLFDGLPMGDYTVRINTDTLPVAKQGNPAYDPDGGNDDQSDVTLTPASPDDLDQDFAYFAPPEPTGSIGDQIWHDDDQDGNNVIDGDDEPIADVVVNLLDADGNVVATDTTDANGEYLFEEVPLGTYTVQVDTSSLPVAKQDNPAYDPDGGNDDMSTVTIDAANPDNTEQDFAYFAPAEPTGSIGDQIWHDDDQDGNDMLDGDDRPLVGVVVNLLDRDGNVIATDTTDNNGTYLFEEVPYGTYVVQIDTSTLPAAKRDNPVYDPDGNADNLSEVTIDAAIPNDLVQDFAYADLPQSTGSIGDQIWHDDDQDGNDVLDGDDEPIEGVTVNLLDSSGTVIGTTVTDANGSYLFSDLPYGSYTVQIDATTLPADKQGNPIYDPDGGNDDQAAVTIDEMTPNNLVQDFAYFAPPPPGAAISLQKTVYAGLDSGAGCPGGEIESGSDVPITYCFEVTNIGDTHLGDIQLTDADLTITRADMTQLSGMEPLAPGESILFYYETVLTADLTNTAETSGNPTDDDGNDLPGVEDPTDSDIAQVKIGASLGDYVWLDKNANGIQDAGEPGLEGVVVNLLDENRNVIATTTTDSGGFYLFDNLTPGDYVIRVELPSAGYEFSPQDQLDDGFDSDIDPQTGLSIVTTLDTGESDRTWDAGIVAAPNLNVEKSASPSSVQPGEVVIYSLSYFNSGIGDSTGVLLTEVVPSNTTFVAEGSSPGWNCQDNAVTEGTICTIEVGDLDAGQRSSEDVFFVVRVNEGVDTAIDTIFNQVLISDDGTNGPSAAGQTVDEAMTVIQHPTAIEVDFEPGNSGGQMRQIFLPAVARNQFKQNGEAIELSVDQLVMSWVCSFMENFGWTSDACFIEISE